MYLPRNSLRQRIGPRKIEEKTRPFEMRFKGEGGGREGGNPISAAHRLGKRFPRTMEGGRERSKPD